MPPVQPGATVAVTGATGFLGTHVCSELLGAGYRVRAVVRDPSDEAKVAHLRGLPGAGERLTLHRGLLDVSGSYDAAFDGADAVIHTAAVVEIDVVKDPEAQIVRPSIEGVQNVLASADRASSVRRFIHTSSELAAVKWDEPPDSLQSEANWNTASSVANGDPYGFAKAKAERLVHEHRPAAYDCIAVLPGVMLGPCLTKAHTKSSAVIVRQYLFGNSQNEYHCHFVDVRDSAVAHVRALAAAFPDGDNRRVLAVSDNQMPVSALEKPLRRLFPRYLIEAKPFPGPLLKLVLAVPLVWGAFTSEFRRHWVQQTIALDNRKSRELLGVQYRPLDDTLRETVNSMVDSGFVKPRMVPEGGEMPRAC